MRLRLCIPAQLLVWLGYQAPVLELVLERPRLLAKEGERELASSQPEEWAASLRQAVMGEGISRTREPDQGRNLPVVADNPPLLVQVGNLQGWV